jgi:SH3-like domain-containing protein
VEKQRSDLQASNVSDSMGMDKVFVFNCPYLGTPEDSDTSLAYPASANHCFRTDTPMGVDLAHQETYCLTDQHPNCHVFQMASAAADEIEPLAAPATEQDKGKRRLSLYALPLILVLILLAAIIWWPAPGTTIQESLVLGDQNSEELSGGATLTGKPVVEPATADDAVAVSASNSVVESTEEATLNDVSLGGRSANKAPSSANGDEKNEADTAETEAKLTTSTASSDDEPAQAAAKSEQEITSTGAGQAAKDIFVETEVVNKGLIPPEETQTTATETSSDSVDTTSADEAFATSEIEEISATVGDLEGGAEEVVLVDEDESSLALVTGDLPVIAEDTVAVAPAPVETVATNDAGESVVMVGPVASTALSLGDDSEKVSPLIMYESSAADGAILSLIESRQFVTFLGRDQSGAWLKIRLADGLEGWINANQSGTDLDNGNAPVESVQNIPSATSYPVIRYAYVDTGALNLRSGPGIEYEPFTIINKGEIVGLIGRRALGPWVRVRLDDGTEGWVNSSLLAPVT